MRTARPDGGWVKGGRGEVGDRGQGWGLGGGLMEGAVLPLRPICNTSLIDGGTQTNFSFTSAEAFNLNITRDGKRRQLLLHLCHNYPQEFVIMDLRSDVIFMMFYYVLLPLYTLAVIILICLIILFNITVELE